MGNAQLEESKKQELACALHLRFKVNVFAKEASQWVIQAMKNAVEDLFLDFSQASLGSHPISRIFIRTAKFELQEKLFRHEKKYCSSFNAHFGSITEDEDIEHERV